MNNRYITKTGFVAEPGTVLDGKYELVRPIGEGGTATVWEANHLLGRFPCVVKFMNRTRKAYELGLDEFRLLSNLYHPSIVRTFAIGLLEEHDHIYLSMELLDGTSLVPYAEGKQTASPLEVLDWLRAMVDVLAYIHRPEVRIIHKDIKPANIMVGSSGAKLIDFNIAEAGEFNHGTTPYKCPSVEADMRWSRYADLWALAVTFYEVLVGQPLFESQTSFDVELTDSYPTGFPPRTFEALKALIRGEGRADELDQDAYHKLFRTDERPTIWTTIPVDVATEFSITSRNQKFLALALMNQTDPSKLRSKNAVIRDALRAANRPAGDGDVKKLRAVYSQLKGSGVVEYGHKGNNAARLTDAFRKALADAD